MTASRDAVGDLDLLAYADGFLDRDPSRRDAVERFLAEHPDAAARVADYRAQNDALRLAGAAWAGAPVPDRLLDVVYRERTGGRLAARVAAVAVLVALAGAGGWLAGNRGPAADALGAFADQARADHGRHHADPPAPIPALAAGVASQGAAPLNWLTRRISVRIQVPDLSAYGYHLDAQERIALDGESAVRLGYRHDSGGRVHIYLRPRWQNRPAPVERTEAEGVTVLRWLDGPLAVAVTTDRGTADGRIDPLVSAVRTAVADASVARPRTPLSHDALLLEPVAPGQPRPAGRSGPEIGTN